MTGATIYPFGPGVALGQARRVDTLTYKKCFCHFFVIAWATIPKANRKAGKIVLLPIADWRRRDFPPENFFPMRGLGVALARSQMHTLLPRFVEGGHYFMHSLRSAVKWKKIFLNVLSSWNGKGRIRVIILDKSKRSMLFEGNPWSNMD